MSKVLSSRGSVVDFELMDIMANINANKNTPKVQTTPKFYNVEQDIAYVEAISTEQFLREQLANGTIPSSVVDKPQIVETPVKLEVVSPTVESEEVLVESAENKDAEDIAEVKNNRRR